LCGQVKEGPGPSDDEVDQPRAGGSPRRLDTGSQVHVGEAGQALSRGVLPSGGAGCRRRRAAGGAGETLRVLTVQQAGDFWFVIEHVSSFPMVSMCRWLRYRAGKSRRAFSFLHGSG
jgi:hypothetical protein